MTLRQEMTSEKRSYNSSPRPVQGVPKYRSGTDWSKMPDYSRLAQHFSRLNGRWAERLCENSPILTGLMV